MNYYLYKVLDDKSSTKYIYHTNDGKFIFCKCTVYFTKDGILQRHIKCSIILFKGKAKI